MTALIRHMRRTLLVGITALIVGLFAHTTAGDEARVRRVGIGLKGAELLTSFSFQDAFTPSIQKKLASGLPTRVVTQINLERRGASKPFSLWIRSATIVYDLWEEVFIVTVEDPVGRRHAKSTSVKKATELACVLSQASIADAADVQPGIYRLRVLVEVNPVSKEMVENIRRWLARPPAGKTGMAAQSNFFGSFVGIFVDRRIGDADRSLTFVSQWFRLGES